MRRYCTLSSIVRVCYIPSIHPIPCHSIHIIFQDIKQELLSYFGKKETGETTKKRRSCSNQKLQFFTLSSWNNYSFSLASSLLLTSRSFLFHSSFFACDFDLFRVMNFISFNSTYTGTNTEQA